MLDVTQWPKAIIVCNDFDEFVEIVKLARNNFEHHAFRGMSDDDIKTRALNEFNNPEDRACVRYNPHARYDKFGWDLERRYKSGSCYSSYDFMSPYEYYELIGLASSQASVDVSEYL